ncbi:TPA: DUF1642 domain-containing protein [Streptococcus pneumoniae]|nr:DUF1642 domain-containing protein [Streptococcus pneumoniae]
MNKQELIEKYEYMSHACFRRVDTLEVLKDLRQLDEPEKVVVPHFVADYIEFQKKNNFHVYGAMRVIEDHYDKRVPDWFYEKNIETFVRAWLDGYAVEKEPKYTVRMKGINGYGRYLNKALLSKEYFFASDNEISGYRTKHTRKELEEAGFGWIFSCEGIEVKEVE